MEKRAVNNKSGSLRGSVAAGAICALVLFQGGYYAGATCVIGLVGVAAYLVYAVSTKRRVASITVAGLFLIAVLYLVSAVAHGATATMLQETCTWFAVAGLALWCIPSNARDKRKGLDYIATAGVVLSGVGILMFIGVLPFEGTVNAGRLMFTFQYANTAGLFFALIAMLCLASEDVRRNALAVLPVVALCMTMSVGAFAVFVLALVALGVMRARQGRIKRLHLLVALALLVVVLAAAVLLFQGRIAQAAQTFIERIVQMLDALSLLAGNVLAGIGPDQWQFDYRAVQSAQYSAANVHCSYLQIALDAGALAGLAMIGLIAYGLVRLAKAGDHVGMLCVAMIALHAVFDFDLQFSAMLLMLAALLEEPSGGEVPAWHRAQAAFRVVPFAIAACALAASFGGIFIDMRMGALQNACAANDAESARAILSSDRLLGEDESALLSYAGAAYRSGEYREAADLVSEHGSSGSESAGRAQESQEGESAGWGENAKSAGRGRGGALRLYRAMSLYALGERDNATDALAQALGGCPYDVELYRAAGEFVSATGYEDLIAAFNAAAASANELAGVGHASWLSSQEQIELIGES